MKIIGTVRRPKNWGEEYTAFLRAQAAEKSMSEEDMWTFYRMVYEL